MNEKSKKKLGGDFFSLSDKYYRSDMCGQCVRSKKGSKVSY